MHVFKIVCVAAAAACLGAVACRGGNLDEELKGYEAASADPRRAGESPDQRRAFHRQWLTRIDAAIGPETRAEARRAGLGAAWALAASLEMDARVDELTAELLIGPGADWASRGYWRSSRGEYLMSRCLRHGAAACPEADAELRAALNEIPGSIAGIPEAIRRSPGATLWAVTTLTRLGDLSKRESRWADAAAWYVGAAEAAAAARGLPASPLPDDEAYMPETFLSHAAVCAAERGDADEMLRFVERIDALQERIRPASFHLVVAMNRLQPGNGVVGGAVTRWMAAHADDMYTPRLAFRALDEASHGAPIEVAALWARTLTARLRPFIESSAEAPPGGIPMIEAVLDRCAIVFSQAGDRESAAACRDELAAARALREGRGGGSDTGAAGSSGPIEQRRR